MRRAADDTERALRASEQRLLEEQTTLRRVAAIARDVAAKPDARASICAAVVELTGADFATVMEPAGDRLS